jgi:hypothetical protein
MILKLILLFQLKYIYNTKFLPPALHINAATYTTFTLTSFNFFRSLVQQSTITNNILFFFSLSIASSSPATVSSRQ